MKKYINKFTAVLLTMFILLGFVQVDDVSAAGEFYYVNNSKVNAHTGTVLVNTRMSSHGNLVHQVGDKIEGTTYYQI